MSTSNTQTPSSTATTQISSSEKDALRVVLQRHASGRDPESHIEVPSSNSPADTPIIPPAAPVAPTTAAPTTPAAAKPRAPREKLEDKPLSEIFITAGKRALGGGLPGAMAMAIQVGSLMWLRTTMNYQYRYGTSTTEALKALYKEGGIVRFYRGIGPALIQGPLSRFGDTASNAGMLSLLNATETTRDLPIAVKTGCASFAAGAFRIALMPVDTVKTIMQVEGKNGIPMLRKKISNGGVRVLFHGSLGAMGATMVGHFPWFFTYNSLSAWWQPIPTDFASKLGRNATIGFCSSVVSDCISNSVRVVKTTKQTYHEPISYPATVKMVIEKDGVSGLFIRGLGTRIIANGFQGLLFSVLWKYLEEQLLSKTSLGK